MDPHKMRNFGFAARITSSCSICQGCDNPFGLINLRAMPYFIMAFYADRHRSFTSPGSIHNEFGLCQYNFTSPLHCSPRRRGVLISSPGREPGERPGTTDSLFVEPRKERPSGVQPPLRGEGDLGADERTPGPGASSAPSGRVG